MKKPLLLPDSLTPHAILQEKLLILIQSSKIDSSPGKNKHYNRCRYFMKLLSL